MTSNASSVTAQDAWQQQYRSPIKLVRKYYQNRVKHFDLNFGFHHHLSRRSASWVCLTLPLVRSYDGKLRYAGVAQW
jgi:hypothetical protein